MNAAGRTPELTDEQLHIIALVARGLTDQSIADRLALSVPTLQRRLHAAAHELGVDSRVALVVRAIARGLIDAAEIDAAIGTRPQRDDGTQR